jgi:hypothetical protein
VAARRAARLGELLGACSRRCNRAGAPPLAAATLAAVLGTLLAACGATPWRRLIVAAGFPLSLLARARPRRCPAGPGSRRSPRWRSSTRSARGADAPLFPTPRGALRGLAAQLALPGEGRFLDAGCGLGDALIELRREFPRATLEGIEWSACAAPRLRAALRLRDGAPCRHVDAPTGRAYDSSTSSSARRAWSA